MNQAQRLTLSKCSMKAEDLGVLEIGVRMPSIMDIIVSGTWRASLHLFCQLGIFIESISFA